MPDYYETRHNTTYWQAYSGLGTWDSGNNEWDSYDLGSYGAVYLERASTWTASYRPTKIRVTFYQPSADGFSVTIANSSFESLFDSNVVSKDSGEQVVEFNISLSADMYYLILRGDLVDQTISIRNIEFYNAP